MDSHDQSPIFWLLRLSDHVHLELGGEGDSLGDRVTRITAMRQYPYLLYWEASEDTVRQSADIYLDFWVKDSSRVS